MTLTFSQKNWMQRNLKIKKKKSIYYNGYFSIFDLMYRGKITEN